jgi:hypothetical protein
VSAQTWWSTAIREMVTAADTTVAGLARLLDVPGTTAASWATGRSEPREHKRRAILARYEAVTGIGVQLCVVEQADRSSIVVAIEPREVAP